MTNMILSWFTTKINLNSVVIVAVLLTILLVVILLIVIIIVYRIGKYTERLASFEKIFNKVNYEQDKISETLHDMKNKLDMLHIKVDSFNQNGQGPLSLIKSDEDIANYLNIDSKLIALINNESNIMQKLSKNKNAYDIQINCIEWAKNDLNNFLDHIYLDKIKNKAYSLGIPEEDVLYIFGLKLRDMILNELDIPMN